MGVFRNFIFAFVFVGIVTRIVRYFLLKKINKMTAAYSAFAIAGIFLVPIASFFIGWDVFFAEYLSSLIVWLLFDILRSGEKK